MAAQALIQTHRDNGAKVFRGNAVCRKKLLELLKDLSLPLGLIPLEDVEEFGHDRAAGFIWVAQKKKKEHTFKKINQNVSYGTDITGFVEARRMGKLTGVKTRELLLWLTITDVYIDDPASGKITFKTGTRLSESFDVAAFGPEE